MFRRKKIINKSAWDKKRWSLKSNSGQALLLTTVMMGGLFMLATSIAGLLMFYQIQQSTDAGNSTIAIYAADAALEEATYGYFKETQYVYGSRDQANCYPNPCSRNTITLPNNAIGRAELIIPTTTIANATTTITATGRDAGGRTVRLLQTTFLVTPTR